MKQMIEVYPLMNYHIYVIFEAGDVKIYDLRSEIASNPLLRELRGNEKLFRNISLDGRGLTLMWNISTQIDIDKLQPAHTVNIQATSYDAVNEAPYERSQRDPNRVRDIDKAPISAMKK